MGDKRCMGCMERFPDKLNMCPFCGYVVDTPVENAVHIEPGTLLADRYIVGKVLGYGGFGVTYVGWDGKLRQKVAIKEYFPTEFSTRMPGKTMLTLSNDQKKREQFESGLLKFVDEAKRLAKFQNTPGIVKIFDAFKENDTAYIIMEYLEGETLTEMLARVGTIDEDRAVNMLMPVMKSLETVHQTGIIHRDIAPDNIFITKDGDVKLIDFGASRYATTSHSRSITVIIKPGYSPEEQYRSRGDQGPHTDVYALAATLYKMITGTVPPDALERRTSCETKRRDLIRLPHLLNKRISKNIENALLNALNVRIEDRTPDIESFIQELRADPPVKRRYGNIKKIDLYQWPLWTKIAIPVAALLIIVGGVFAINSIIHISPPSEAVIPDGMVVVPDIEGEKMSVATSTIKKGSLNATIAGNIESDYIEAEKIVLQDPLGGSYQDRYGNVNIWVSGGKIIELVVPLLSGSTEDEALSKLNEAGFKNIRKAGEEYDELVEAGLIKSQSPEYTGEKVSEDTEITYIVSLGPKPFSMPSVAGKTVEEAEAVLKDTGLKISYTQVVGDDKDVGKIKEQSIKAGESAKKGDEVVLSVITKKPTIDVEDVVGLDKAEAESKLKAQGFKVNTGDEEYSDEPEGRVLRQNPAAGSSQTEGTTITIVVSRGPQQTSIIKPSEESEPEPEPDSGSVSKPEPEKNTKISVSNVVGKTRNVAETILVNQGFAVSVTSIYSDRYSAGYVMEQDPSAGSYKNKGATVKIFVSKGTEKVSVPDVTGKSQSAARSALEDKGFKVSISESYNSSVSKGTVFSQSPNSGSMAEKGATVIIVVSLGEKPPEAVTVPNVAGKSQSDASSILTNAGLKVSVNESYSSTVAAGKVISQSPASGNSVDKNSTVTITVSKGVQKVTVPNVAGKSQSIAESTLKNTGLKVSVNESYSNTVAAGNVISQSPSSGSSVNKNSTVTITVSKGAEKVKVPNVTGKSESAATSALKNAGFKISIKQDYSNTVTSGNVISQSPSAGSSVAKNSTVTITVSMGSKPVSGWVLISEMPKDAEIVEHKWVYDYVTTTTSNSSELSGYTRYDETWEWGNWGDWSGWQNDYISSSDSREVDTQYISPTYKTQYNYNRWSTNNSYDYPGNHGPCKGTWGGRYCQYYFEHGWTDERLPYFGSQDSNQYGHFDIWGTNTNAWYNEWTQQVQTGGDYTQYRYRERSKIYTYYFRKTETKESSTQVTAGGNISNVREYVKYR